MVSENNTRSLKMMYLVYYYFENICEYLASIKL